MSASLYRSLGVRAFVAFIFVICASHGAAQSKSPQAPVVSQLRAEPTMFAPARDELARVLFVADKPGQAIVRLFGPDWHQVRELALESIEAGQTVSVEWDGLDDEGKPVPAEAYFPVIEFVDQLGQASTLDPSLKSAAVPVLLENLHFHADTGTISYSLPAPARVTLHAGISSGGPLLRTLLADVPRDAGAHSEAWDGMDENSAVNIGKQKDLRLFADGVSLWQPSIIVTGDFEQSYAIYRRRTESRLIKEPLKLEEYGGTPAALPRPHDITPEPRFRVSVPGPIGGDGLPIVSGRVRVQVALDESVRIPVLERRFEIVLFSDLQFVTEVEEGRSPASIIWDSTQLPDGERLLTVNVATLPGQMSSASVRVRVKNSP